MNDNLKILDFKLSKSEFFEELDKYMLDINMQQCACLHFNNKKNRSDFFKWLEDNVTDKTMVFEGKESSFVSFQAEQDLISFTLAWK